MKRRRASRTQSRDELASHMGQRQRLEGHCERLIRLFADQTFPIMKKRHVATMEWFKDATKHLRLIVNINFSTKAIGKGVFYLKLKTAYFCNTHYSPWVWWSNWTDASNNGGDKDENWDHSKTWNQRKWHRPKGKSWILNRSYFS